MSSQNPIYIFFFPVKDVPMRNIQTIQLITMNDRAGQNATPERASLRLPAAVFRGSESARGDGVGHRRESIDVTVGTGVGSDLCL